MNGTPDEMWLNYFHKGFTIDAHQLIAWGYHDARAQLTSADEEEVISKAIVRAIKVRLGDPKIETPERFKEYFVEVETHPMENSRAGKESPRIDIKIESGNTKPRPEFVFESKRLKKGSHGIKKYVGISGMQCFLQCQYAENYPSAAMLGYMQDQASLSHWQKELTRRFKPENDLNIQKPLEKCKILDEFPNEWFSSHGRTKDAEKRPDIGIYHIFLECHTLD